MKPPCLLLVAASLLSAVSAAELLPSFPGAVGYGAKAKGGRGGAVLFVDNLNDSGPGSLRAALESEGPRTVVFRTGGTIVLKKPIKVIHPFLTIAGQTAPGGGICITNEPWDGDKSAIQLRTHDVIVRHLRIRTALPPPPDPGENLSNYAWVDPISLWGEEAHHIILDHLSTSWGFKDAIRLWDGPHDVTIQNCILSEDLTPGRHSKGALVGGGSDRVTFLRNLFAHNEGRNPYVKAGDEDAKGTVATFQIINNVMYDWGDYAVEVGVDDSKKWSPAPGNTRLNFIGNYFKPGPNTDLKRHEVVAGQVGMVSIYASGNLGPLRPDESADEWAQIGLRWQERDQLAERGVPAPKKPFQSKVPFDAEELPAAIPAPTAFEEVLKHAGAVRPQRDAVDERVVRQVQDGTGRIIADPKEVGGWPKLASGKPPADRDNDGMPDAWEKEHGLNPDDAEDRNGTTKPGSYTHLEEYLNRDDQKP